MIEEMCETKLLYIGENLFGVLKCLPLNRPDTPPIVLSDVQSSRIIDRDVSENIHLTIIGLSRQRGVPSVEPTYPSVTQSSDQPAEADSNTDIKPATSVKTDPDGKLPLNVFGNAYADLIATKVVPIETASEIEISDVRAIGMLKSEDEQLDDTTHVTDPNSALHGAHVYTPEPETEHPAMELSHPPVSVLPHSMPTQLDNEPIPIDIVPVDELVSLDTLQDATTTGTGATQPDQCHDSEMLQEVTSSTLHIIATVTLQEATLCGAAPQEAAIPTTSVTSIVTRQEATLNRVALQEATIPITSATSNVTLQEATLCQSALPEAKVYPSTTTEGTPLAALQDATIRGESNIPASAMPEDPSETRDVIHTLTIDAGKYYACLAPSQDEVIYLHHDDIVNTKCTVNLNRLTPSEFSDLTQRSTAELDNQDNVADPNWPPKKKVKGSSRPCSKPSQSHI